MPRSINESGLGIIKYYEGLKLEAYKDIGGILTIGYGHTGHDVIEGQKITVLQAEMLLLHDIESTEKTVDQNIKTRVNANQYSACVSLAYNIGVGNFQDSTLLKFINKSDFKRAADQFLVWDKVKGTEVKGLLARRRAERDLFMKDV